MSASRTSRPRSSRSSAFCDSRNLASKGLLTLAGASLAAGAAFLAGVAFVVAFFEALVAAAVRAGAAFFAGALAAGAAFVVGALAGAFLTGAFLAVGLAVV